MLLGWHPKEKTIYAPHDTIKRRLVGQKEYSIDAIISRKEEIVIDKKVYTGTFILYDDTCQLNIKSNNGELLHRFLTHKHNVRFKRKIVKTTREGQNTYGQRFRYPETEITYIAEVVDPNKLEDTLLDLRDKNNTEITRLLFSKGVIKAKEPEFIYKKADVKPDIQKIEGMLLGIAIGDSLGNTTESLLPKERIAKYGKITDYLPNRYANGKRIGLPSDDTQLAFDTVETILENGYLNMDALAHNFASHKIFGIGSTVKEFLKNYKEKFEPWYYAGVTSNGAGNGALMRIEPVLLTNLINKKENIYADAILATMLTHNDALAIGSSIAFIDMLNNAISSRLNKTDFVRKFASTLDKFIGRNNYQPRSKAISADFAKTPGEFIEKAIETGFDKNMSVLEFGDYFGSGAYLLETDATMLYIISKYMEGPQEAIIQAINYTKDNDTIGSLVAATMGALYGKAAFRESWIANLSGKTRENDEGKIFEMINRIKSLLSKKIAPTGI